MAQVFRASAPPVGKIFVDSRQKTVANVQRIIHSSRARVDLKSPVDRIRGDFDTNRSCSDEKNVTCFPCFSPTPPPFKKREKMLSMLNVCELLFAQRALSSATRNEFSLRDGGKGAEERAGGLRARATSEICISAVNPFDRRAISRQGHSHSSTGAPPIAE